MPDPKKTPLETARLRRRHARADITFAEDQLRRANTEYARACEEVRRLERLDKRSVD